MHRKLADYVVPLRPIPRRRDDAAVAEHRLPRVACDGGRHERQLHDRTQADLEQLVVESVDPAEIEGQATVGGTGHHIVVVVQDRVCADMGDPEVVVRAAQRLGELGADVVAVAVVAEPQLGQALGADHAPHPVEPSDDRRRVDSHLHVP